MDKSKSPLRRKKCGNNLSTEGLSYSDYFDDNIPYEVKPVPNVVPMEETDWPIQTRSYGWGNMYEDSPIKLKSLMETDYLSYKGKTYAWHRVGTDALATINVYEDDAGEKHYLASVYKSGQKEFLSDDKELEELCNAEFSPNTNYRHVDLYEILFNERGVDESDLVLKGRVFDVEENYVFATWEHLNELRDDFKIVKEFLKRMKLDPKTIWYSHHGGTSDEILTYEDVFGLESPDKENKNVKLLQLIHTSDKVKQSLLKLPPNKLQSLADKIGVPIIQLKQRLGMDESKLLKETEFVNYKGEKIGWSNEGVMGIFIIYESNNKFDWAASLLRPTLELFGTNEEYLHILKSKYRNPKDVRMHYDLYKHLYDRDVLIQGRIFKASDGQIIIGLWENMAEVRMYRNTIENIVKTMGFDPKRAVWLHSGGASGENRDETLVYGNIFYTYNDFFISSKPMPVASQENINLLKVMHLNNMVKRELLKALETTPNRYQILADKMGITVVQLKRILQGIDKPKKFE